MNVYTSLVGLAVLSTALGCSDATPRRVPPPSGASATGSGGDLSSEHIAVTEENYAHAETARNFRNWMKAGAERHIVHMRGLPPRGRDAPTVQMNDDTLYSIAIVETRDGKVQFSIPEVDVYIAVQVVNEGGHGEHYVVDAGTYDLAIESEFAFLIYRVGVERGLDASRQAQDQIETGVLNFGDYALPNYDFEEVEAWTSRLTAETQGQPFRYTFPRASVDVTDRHQWNLENANGWGGSSPEVGVANSYTNSVLLSADECLSTTFEDPQSRYFTSVTAYDRDRYLLPDVRNVNSHTWDANDDGTITVSFNCGDDAPNNIDTRGHGFSFTMRYYGVSQKVVDLEIAPETTVR